MLTPIFCSIASIALFTRLSCDGRVTISSGCHAPAGSDCCSIMMRRLFNAWARPQCRSEEHTSELQSLMRISYAVFCLKKKKHSYKRQHSTKQTVNATQSLHL